MRLPTGRSIENGDAVVKDAKIPSPAIILIGASVSMSLALGMRQCLGLFLPPMTHDLGLTASDFTIADRRAEHRLGCSAGADWGSG